MKVVFPLTAAAAVVLLLSVGDAGAVMIGHWKFDETSGTTAVDSINGNNGAYQASDDPEPGWQTGVIGGATGLSDEDNSEQEYFIVSEIPQMDGATQLSISIWFNANDELNDNDGNNGLFRTRNLQNTTSTGRAAGMNQESFHIDARMASGNGQADSENILSALPGWQHALMTWDSTDDSGGAGTGLTKVYVNGQLSGSASHTDLAKAVVDSGEWWIGGVDCCGTTRGWTGALDDLAVWDEVLSEQTVADIYNDGLFGIDAFTAWQESITPKTPGDVTGEGDVTSADYAVIQANFRQALGPRTSGDLINNNFIDIHDYLDWARAPKTPEGLVAGSSPAPEPVALALLAAGVFFGRTRCRG